MLQLCDSLFLLHLSRRVTQRSRERSAAGARVGNCACRDPVDNCRTAALPVEDEPGESDRTAGFRPSPAMPVHHRKAIAKYMDAGEAAGFQNRRATLGLQERQPQKHDNTRHKLESVRDEFIGEGKGWIGQDAGNAGGRLVLIKEVNTAGTVGAVPVVQVGGNHVMLGSTQHVDDCATTAGWFPNQFRQTLDLHECARRHGRRFIVVRAAISERVAAGVCAVGSHGHRLRTYKKVAGIRAGAVGG
jgi:hypothetical protein